MARTHDDAQPDPTFAEFMAQGWGPEPPPVSGVHPAAAHFAERRDRLSQSFPGKTLVIPTGGLKTRSGDVDYRFRPGSAFHWLTGSTEPGGVLIVRPGRRGPRATLYVMPRRDHTTPGYFGDPVYGEGWTGPRPGLREAHDHLGIATASLEHVTDALRRLDPATTLLLRGVDARFDGLVKPHPDDRKLVTTIDRLRLVKDDFEIAEIERAVAATVRGFEDVVRALPQAVATSERFVEGVFSLRARVEGNDVGFPVIAAAGANATTLHWDRNNGPVVPGDVLILDAGIETDQLYNSDVTRTIPVSGHFSAAQREVYDVVLAAQRAGIEAAKPGAGFAEMYNASRFVLSRGLRRLGIPSGIPGAPAWWYVSRYMGHGLSHDVGVDMHDCQSTWTGAQWERRVLAPGHVVTVEPGLYFKPNDRTVPERYRGIGVRIEDDVLITGSGHRVLSAALPTDPGEVERWMRRVRRAAPVWPGSPGAAPAL